MNVELWVMDMSVAIGCSLFGLAASLTVTPAPEVPEQLGSGPSAAPDGGWGERVDYDARSLHEGIS